MKNQQDKLQVYNNMKKKTIYDRSLVDNIRQKQAMYNEYVAPKVNLDAYQFEMQNPAGQTYTPDDYDILNYVSDAFAKWQESRNSVERDKALGDYIMEEEEYNNFTKARQFLDDQDSFQQIMSQVKQDPNLYNENKDAINELGQRLKENAGVYARYVQEWVPNTYKDDITKSFDSKGIRNMLDLQITDKENKLQSYLAKAEENQEDINYWGDRVSSFYNKKEQSTPFSFTDIDSYLYKVPGLMGSSAANYGWQALAIGSALLASTASGGMALPFVGTSLVGTIGARDAESKSEVYSNYRDKINQMIDEKTRKSVLDDTRAKMEVSGKYTPEQISDDNYVLDQVLTGVIASDNAKFNRDRMKARQGIESLYTDNMALSTLDAAELALQVVPIGRLAKLVKSIPGISKAATYAGDLQQQLSKRIDDVVTYGLEGVDRLPKRRTVQRLVDLGGRIGITAISEGAEEGIQYIKGQRFINNEFDPDPTILKSFVKNIGTGARAIYAAITPWDPVYSDDAEFMENFKGGALLGGLMTSAIGGVQTATTLPGQVSADQFVANLYADKLEVKDRVRKNILYGQKIQQGRWANVEDAFDYLNTQDLDEGAKQEVTEEKQRAAYFRNTYTAPSTLYQAAKLDIDPRTDTYNEFVALKDHHERLALESLENKQEAERNFNTLLNDKEVDKYITSLSPTNLSAENKLALRVLIRNKATLDKIKELNQRYQENSESLNRLQQATGIRTNKADVVKFSQMLRKDLKEVQRTFDKQLADIKTVLPELNEEQLVVPSLHENISDAMETLVAADMDNARALEELKIMRSTDKRAIQAKLDKWHDVEDKEIDFVQELDNFYNEKDVEEAIENTKEVEPVTLDNEVPSIVQPEAQTEQQITQEEQIVSQPVATETDTEPEDITQTRRQALETQNKYTEQVTDDHGKTSTSIKGNTAPGVVYNKLSGLLKEQFEKAYPTKKYTRMAETVMDNEGDIRSDFWQDINSVKKRLEDALYSGDEKAIQSLTNKAKRIIKNYPNYDATIDFITESRNKLVERMKARNASRFADIRKNLEETETPTQTVDPITLLIKQPKTTPEQADFVPTLGGILKGMLGDIPTSQPLTQVATQEPTITAPIEQPKSVQLQQNTPNTITYNPAIDAYSHRLVYDLTGRERDKDGRYFYAPKKYRGNDYLNNQDFALATQNRDFLQKAQIEVEVQPYTDTNGNTVNDIFTVFTYEGKKYAAYTPTQNYLSQDKAFQRMPAEQQKIIRDNLETLRNKIFELDKQKKANPKLRIIPTRVTSTNGQFLNEFNEDGSPKNRSLLESAWLKEKDPYKINASNTRIGIATGPISNSVVRYQDQTVSFNGSRLGTMQMLVEVDRLDGTIGTAQMQLNPLKLTGNDAAADVILKLVTSNQRDFVDANGILTQNTNDEVLSFLVNYGDHTATDPNDNRLTPEQRRRRLDKQFYKDENGNIMLGQTLYTMNELLTNPQSQQKFKDYIKDNFHFALDEQGLQNNFVGRDTSSSLSSKQKGIGSFSSALNGKSADKIVIIPGQVEFTLKDLGLKKVNGINVKDPSNDKGISVLGWYIKNGWIQTNTADRMYNVGLWIDDVTISDKYADDIQQQAQSKINEASKEEHLRSLVFDLPGDKPGEREIIRMSDVFDILDGKGRKKGPTFVANEPTSPINQIDITNAKQWLQDKLGLTDEQIEVSKTVIDVTASGAKVMGQARLDAIALSEQAPEGVQYHEAWHRVSQLLISDKKRRSLYDRYNRRNKTKLTDTQIDEILAEDYRQFAINADQSIYTKGFDISKWFKRIADFVRIWAKTGQYTLAQLYTGISRGKFAGIQPSSENITRFREIYKDSGPNFEVGGNKFDNITSLRQYDDIIKSLTYAFFQTNFTSDTIDYTDVSKLSNNFELLRRTLVNTAQLEPNPVIDEIVQKYDMVFKPAIAKKLKSLGIRAIERKADEEMSSIDAGETEGVNIGQHTVEGMNVSIKDNAPAEVKFFFQTIPLYKLNDQGTIEAYIDPNTGFPQFVDEKEVWVKVLKDLAGSRTIRNMVEKISEKAQNDLFYNALLRKFMALINNSNSSDPNVAVNAEATLSKLETVITSDVNTFITVRITEDDNGFNNFKLIDNNVDMKAAAYPKVWSQALFHNAGIFKYNKDEVVVAQDGAKQKLSKLVSDMKDCMTAFVNNKGILKYKQSDGNVRLIDLHQANNQEMFKQYITSLLNRAGILVDKPTINTMLESGDYGDPTTNTYTLLNKFMTSGSNYGGFARVQEILNTVNKAINQDGTINNISIGSTVTSPADIYNNVGFIKALANAYAYTHATDNSLSSLGPDGTSYYMVSQNNFAKDRISELNENPQLVERLKSVVWNGKSLLLENAGINPLSIETFINFKDQTSHDTGRDYFGITDREDYLAKMTAVFNDRIIFPTVADKKTYHFIKGVQLPHERLQLQFTDRGTVVTYGKDSLDILKGYIQNELDTIELTLRQIDDNPSHFRDGIHYNEDGSINEDWLSPERRIKNYHTPNKYKANGKTYKIEGNGARFRFLTGVYVDGKYISFNDPTKSAYENLDTARRYYFDLTEEGKDRILSDILTERLKGEIKTATDLGIIDNLSPNGQIWGIRNVLLDDSEVESRKSSYTQIDPSNAEAYSVLDMLSDYMINSIISVMEVEKVFSGDPAYYKFSYDKGGLLDISVDKIKRLGALTSTGTNNRLDFFNDPIRQDYIVAELQDYEVASKQYAVYEELFTRGSIKEAIQQLEGIEAWDNVKDLTIKQIEELYPKAVSIARASAKIDVEGYKEGINVADAAVYISPNMFRDLMRMQGKWSPAIKRAFEILTDPETADKWESDPKLYKEANKVILNALKYMAMGTRFSVNGLAIPYFNKMALFPLFKSIATGDLKALYDRMTGDNPIDMVMFNSAVKAGSESPISPYVGTHESEIELKDGQTVLSAEQMKQAEDEHLTNFDNLHTYTQQFKYLRQQLATDPHVHDEQMTGTQFMKVALSNLIDTDIYGKDKLTGAEIKERVMGSLNRLSDIGREELAAELLNPDNTVNVQKLAQMLREDAEDSDANDNIITALTTENGELRMPLDAISDNSWIESRFIAMINKKVVDVNMPGGAFIQRSTFGLEASSSRVITPKMINSGRLLKAINEEGSTDSVVSINLFKHMIPNYEKMTFDQARQWLIDKQIIGDNATANAIGYRIPTQSIASISALRFVDVFPEIMGDTIMLPEDFTKLTGSDFDIDKLYIARYSYDNDGRLVTDPNSQSGIKNTLLNAYMNVLLSLENTNQLKLSIDNATGNVKEVLKDIESGRQKHYVQPFEVYTPSYQEARKAEYTGGKAGIGPFALNNAHHILTQLTHLQMVDDEFTTALNLVDLGKIWDDPTPSNPKGGRILDWLSAMINGFVDIAKDPYIVRLNVNGWTYNMVSYLLRTGKGRSTFYFMSQPILKEMAEAVLKTKGKYGIDRTKSPSRLEREAIESVLDKYDPDKDIRKRFANLDTQAKSIEYADLFTEIVNPDTGEYTYRTRELLKEDAKDSAGYRTEQVRMYYAFQALKPYADALADLVKYSKVDTKKTGKNFAEQLIYRYGMLDLANSPYFGEGEINKFYNQTFIETKTQNSIDFGYGIFANQLFRNTPVFTERLTNVLALLGRKTTATSKILSPIIRGIESQMKSEFFNSLGIDVNSLLTGDQSVPKRLNNFKQRIMRGEYPELLRYDGRIANDFLEYLLPNLGAYDGYDFIDTSEIIQGNQLQADNLINYWRDLLEHPDERVRKLAEDLAIYSFYTTGDNSTQNGFFKYLPNSYRISSGYNDFIKSKLHDITNNGELSTFDKMDILANNWHNDAVVKPINYYKQTDGGYIMMKHASIDEYQVAPNMIIGEYTSSNDPVIRPINWVKVDGNSYPLFPPMVKFRDLGGYTPENWHLYQLIGYREFMDRNNRVAYSPVYALINKKGMKYRGHTIVEYNKADTELPFNQENLEYFDLMDPESIKPYTDSSTQNILNQLHYINELPSYKNQNYARAEQDRVYEDQDYSDEDNTTPLSDKEVDMQEQTVINSPVTKIISGAQTGIDRLGLEVGKELGIETGGTTTPGYYTENGIDLSIKDFGVVEISPELQQGKRGKEFYLPRTEQNVINSDGTAYFATNDDSAGRYATERFAKNHNKPFILNPNGEQLRQWLIDNNIQTLNVAGNRGSRVTEEFYSEVRNTLKQALQIREKVPNKRKTYSGMITSLSPNQVFVFGSNTQGRHDKGAALVARRNFGAIYGQSEGPQGQSYAIITKDLTKSVHPSRTKEQIKEQISKLYSYATDNPDKEFLVAYSGTGPNLNAYSNLEMASFFNSMPIPNNIVFEESFNNLVFPEINQETYTNTQLSSIIELYDLGERRIREELSILELTKEEMQTYLNEFAEMMREENVTTREQVEGVVNKFICQL